MLKTLTLTIYQYSIRSTNIYLLSHNKKLRLNIKYSLLNLPHLGVY